MMFNKSATTLFLGASFCVTPLFAQQAQPVQPGQPARPGVQVQVNPNRTPGAQGAGGQSTSIPVNEHAIAACVAIANQEEVAMAKLAVQKAKDKDVKDFANMMIEEHTSYLKKLQRFAPEAQESLQAASGNSNQSRVQPAGGAAQNQNQATTQPGQGIQQAGNQAGGNQGQQVDMIHLQREIAQQCLADANKKLSDKDGDKFDICYIGHQIAKHEDMKAKLTVFQRHASGELAQVLASGLETTESHLKKAEQIMKSLDSDDNKSEKRDRSDK